MEKNEEKLSPSKKILSPKSPLLKKISKCRKSVRKALEFARVHKGLDVSANTFADFANSSCNTSHALKLARDVIKDETLVDSFSSQLAIRSQGLPLLLISELSEFIDFRFAFEGRVLAKYGTFRIKESSYPRSLKADLVDREAQHTITLVFSQQFISDFVDSFDVLDYLHIEGVAVKKRVKNDGGTSWLALHADATTIIVKAEPFDCEILFFPEHRIKDIFSSQGTSSVDYATIAFAVVKIDNVAKSDGTSIAQLTIADGPSSADRATLSFVPTRKADYHRIVDKIQSEGFYACVAQNIGVFKGRSHTLSIVDCTILTAAPDKFHATLKDVLSKQVAAMGFGKKVFGTLEIVNINGFAVEFVCSSCKGTKVSRQASNPFCFTCDKVVEIIKTPSLQGKITLRDGSSITVLLHGAIVDKILQLPNCFVEMYVSNLTNLKCALVDVKKVGSFTISTQGNVVDYKPEF